MKRKELPWIILVFTILLSLACNTIYGQTNATQPASGAAQPTTSIYPTAITTGGMHACALLSNGKVKCWGSNSSGQLGDGTFTSHSTPIEVPGLENVTAISAGGEFTCALLSDGGVKCFGDNFYGQLGDGTNEKRLTPAPVSGLSDAVSIAAGDEHACALTSANKARCWGKEFIFSHRERHQYQNN